MTACPDLGGNFRFQMLSASGVAATQRVGEALQFGARTLAGLFLVALVARTLGPRETPPESVDGYEVALATRMLRRYGGRWIALIAVLELTGLALARLAT